MKSLKVLMVGVLAVGLVLGAGSFCFAQNAALKVAYVDISRIFDEYSKTKEFDASLEKRHTAFSDQHNSMLQKIKDAETKMDVMKEEERIKIQAQIDKDKADLLAFDREKGIDLKKEREEKIKEILGDIEKVVKDFAVSEKYDLILNDKVLVYSSESMDLTNQMIKILNEKYTPGKK